MKNPSAHQYAVRYGKVDLDLLDRELWENARASILVQQIRKLRKNNRITLLQFVASLKDREGMGFTDDDLPVLEVIIDEMCAKFARMVPEQLLLPKTLKERGDTLGKHLDCPFDSAQIIKMYTVRELVAAREDANQLLIRIQRAELRGKLTYYCQVALQTKSGSSQDPSGNLQQDASPSREEPMN